MRSSDWSSDVCSSVLQGDGAGHCRAEILAERADADAIDDVERARYWIGGDRQAARQGLQHDEAEGVGAAGEDEDVGGGVVRRQRLAVVGAGEGDVRERLLQFGARSEEHTSELQ